MSGKDTLIEYLRSHQINFEEVGVTGKEFPPPDSFWEEKNIHRCKNLFFRDNHGKNHFLVIFDYYKKIDIKKLQEITGRGSMTMASGWRLEKYLGLTPGFISVFGILNDNDQHVQILIDKELDDEKRLSFLPNTNGGSFILIEFKDLIKFIKSRGNEYKIEAL
ncbi:MAG: YbaK/EbsC family protein [Bacteroidales bacterium]